MASQVAVAVVVCGLGGEGQGQREIWKAVLENSLAHPSLLGSAPCSAHYFLSHVLGLRFMNVTFLLTLPSLQKSGEDESNCPGKSTGQRKAGLAMGRTLGRLGIEEGDVPETEDCEPHGSVAVGYEVF